MMNILSGKPLEGQSGQGNSMNTSAECGNIHLEASNADACENNEMAQYDGMIHWVLTGQQYLPDNADETLRLETQLCSCCRSLVAAICAPSMATPLTHLLPLTAAIVFVITISLELPEPQQALPLGLRQGTAIRYCQAQVVEVVAICDTPLVGTGDTCMLQTHDIPMLGPCSTTCHTCESG